MMKTNNKVIVLIRLYIELETMNWITMNWITMDWITNQLIYIYIYMNILVAASRLQPLSY